MSAILISRDDEQQTVEVTTRRDVHRLLSGYENWIWGGAASYDGWAAWVWQTEDATPASLAAYLRSVGEDPAEYSVEG